jgi:hypothetical protein
MLHTDAPLQHLVVSAKEGDEQAWAVLVSRYSGLIWSVARAHRLGASRAGEQWTSSSGALISGRCRASCVTRTSVSIGRP